jgi:hypothetical protein
MTENREVPIGTLIARGIQEQEARHICDNQATVPWHKLARIDGALALAVLTPDEFALITAELQRAGLPAVDTITRQDVISLVWTIAGNECPKPGTLWYSVDLHSAVACAQLLALVQQAWGFDPEAEKQKQLESFGKLLGVAANVEPI